MTGGCLLGEDRDVFVVGNVASGLPDAGIITVAFRKMFPRRRISLVFAKYSPQKEGYNTRYSPDLFPYEEIDISVAREINASIIVVDHLASSGGTIFSFLTNPPTSGERTSFFVSHSVGHFDYTFHESVERVYSDSNTSIGIYRRRVSEV